MTNGTFRPLLCAAALAALACASAPKAPPPPPVQPAARAPAPPSGPGLSFSVEPADAEVLIDGTSHGTVSDLPPGGFVALPPGLYQVSLKRTGYATWRAEVAVRAGPEPIRVTLVGRPAPPAAPAR